MSATTTLARVVATPRRHATIAPTRALAWLLGIVVVLSPAFAAEYWLNSILIPTIAMGLAGIGLNLLMGYAGLVSLGSAAFMSIGAFATYNLLLRAPWLPLPLTLIAAGLITGVVGVFFGLPSLRIKGFYLAASTLGAQFFFEWLFTSFRWFSNNSLTLTISAPRLELFGLDLRFAPGRYLLVVVTTAILWLLAYNIVRSRIGRDWMAIRDMDKAAAVIGIPVARRKLLAYGISSFYTGIAGALFAFAYLGTADAHSFDLDKSFEVLFIVLIGGSASLFGNFLGAAFIVLTPIVLTRLVEWVDLATVFDNGVLVNVERLLFGVIIIVLLIREPDGLASLLQRVVARCRVWPLRA
jgi:branched-chain amino acid transport system permease protein